MLPMNVLRVDAMNQLSVPGPVSGGLILSYLCNSRCKHCMYACSPKWKSDWIKEEKARAILNELSDTIHAAHSGPKTIGVNSGLHFTGGEPFLNYESLVNMVEIASEFSIPSLFVETNCFWCVNDNITKERLVRLKNAGLNGILISVNPFVLEFVPFKRTERAVKISREIFGSNVIVYQEYFYNHFVQLGIKESQELDHYLLEGGIQALSHVELLPLGRSCYSLNSIFQKYPAKRFFGESCLEELSRPWHIHIDNFGNYMPGYCGGISLGRAQEILSLNRISLEERPILHAVSADLQELYKMGTEKFEYKENREGYISKCHLCVDVRRHIVSRTKEFRELAPIQFYRQLD